MAPVKSSKRNTQSSINKRKLQLLISAKELTVPHPKTLALIATIIATTVVMPTVHLFNLIALPVTGSLDTGRIVVEVMISLLLLFDAGPKRPIGINENKKGKKHPKLVLSCFFHRTKEKGK